VFQSGVANPQIVAFPDAGRVWAVMLSYTITSNASFFLSTVRTVASVQLIIGATNLTLAVVQLGVADPNQHAEGSMAISYPGLPTVLGTSIRLNVNNGNVIPQCDQQASVSVLYSLP
jgi:hypothetical protein